MKFPRPLRRRTARTHHHRCGGRDSRKIAGRDRRHRMRVARLVRGAILLQFAIATCVAQQYDFVLQGGYVIDAKNKISAVRDVGIHGGKIAAMEPRLDPAQELKVVNVRGLYVTPGLVDIHVPVYAGAGEPRSYAAMLSAM